MPLRGCTAAGRRLVVIVNVDSSPQPYARLERAIVENGQQFGTERTFAPPQTVSHLGLDASWFPDLDQLLTTDGTCLITISVHRPVAGGGRSGAMRELATGARPRLPRGADRGAGEGRLRRPDRAALATAPWARIALRPALRSAFDNVALGPARAAPGAADRVWLGRRVPVQVPRRPRRAGGRAAPAGAQLDRAVPLAAVHARNRDRAGVVGAPRRARWRSRRSRSCSR